uniref:ankyrin repeat, SAM and basic leucine zipper domain-containing protein 1 n=1 Tax=Monopterus albus TaxID=43700 RepID=UPI0009B4C626|nr:ankyrin repeat, SAM and basic leucine zipper domain-containing protein 1 [Monopterus albus]
MYSGFPGGYESDGSNDEWYIGTYPDKKSSCITVTSDKDLDVALHAGDNVSVLKRAISQGDIGTVEQLLDSGMDVETRLGFEWTPLMCAVNVANYDLAKLLLDRGASANFSKDHWTVLMASCTASASEDKITRCVELLLSRNADPNMVDRSQMTCLGLAARDGYSKVIDLLVSHGAEINVQDSNGYTALAIAVQYGRMEAVLKLLQLGADKYIRTNAGKSPADLAVTFKHREISSDLAASSHISSAQPFSSMKNILSKFFSTKDEPPSSKESVKKLDELQLLLHGLDLDYLTDKMTVSINCMENDITWSCLLTMEKEDLEKIGITDPVDQQKLLSAAQQMHLHGVDLDTLLLIKGLNQLHTAGKGQAKSTFSGMNDVHNKVGPIITLCSLDKLTAGKREQCCYLTETVQAIISRFPCNASQLVFELDSEKRAQVTCNQIMIQINDLQKEVTILHNLLFQHIDDERADGKGRLGAQGTEAKAQVGGVREFKLGERGWEEVVVRDRNLTANGVHLDPLAPSLGSKGPSHMNEAGDCCHLPQPGSRGNWRMQFLTRVALSALGATFLLLFYQAFSGKV